MPVKTPIIAIFLLFQLVRPFVFAAEPAAPAQAGLEMFILVQKHMGGEALFSLRNYTGFGRVFSLKGEQMGWDKFWYYYSWPGKEHTDFEDQDEGLAEIYNLGLNAGWHVEYDKVKEMTSDEISQFRRSEKHSLLNILRQDGKTAGLKFFHFGPENFDTVVPTDAIEVQDETNDSTTIYFEDDSNLPSRIEFTETNAKGYQEKRVERYSRWFQVEGVYFPYRIEILINGVTKAIVEYEYIKANQKLANSLFEKPLPNKVPKALQKKRKKQEQEKGD